MNNIVLVHGGFVDGSGWESVYQILKEDGYNVSIVQNPTISLEDDVAVTRRILAAHSTGSSSAPPSRPTWTRKKPRSWPTPKSHGAWRLSAARSANRRGRPSRAGT